ncbi:MAG: mandelate racemase/muconate lactonizing enzyme family protein [Rhodospirillales bacterium]|jgi:L-alanine-DL-glutamate epimerase-like enolase superfamily enzyme|nr:mandelate racemase/muconate lactonizing enzyme family protein [Rhodospirillales bacterium]
MAKIETLSACAVCVPLDRPTSFATRDVVARDYALVEVATDDGERGIGFCYAGSTGGTLVAAAVRELLTPLVVGRDPHLTEGLWAAMYQETLLHGRAGAVMRAISAVDIALWDRNARAANLPLHRFLGAAREGTVPAYASGGYYLDGKTPKMLGDELVGYVGQGFGAVKIKVGRLSLAEEEARIAAARQAIGDDVILMLDANNAWSDLPTALRFVSMYAGYDPYWIEEPFSPDDIDNHVRLAEATDVAVATGEIEAGRWRFKELLEREAAAFLQPDAAVCGGVTEFRRIAATAASFSVPVCPHWFHDLHAPLLAAIPNGEYVEYFPDDQVLNFRRLVDGQLEVTDGALALRQTPGLGFAFDQDAVNAYAIDAWA